MTETKTPVGAIVGGVLGGAVGVGIIAFVFFILLRRRRQLATQVSPLNIGTTPEPYISAFTAANATLSGIEIVAPQNRPGHLRKGANYNYTQGIPSAITSGPTRSGTSGITTPDALHRYTSAHESRVSSTLAPPAYSDITENR
jgi:hypothetical protein